MKDRAGDMLGGVNFTVHSEDLLGGWNADVVKRAETEMIESGAEGRPAGKREPCAACAAVEIQHQLGMPADNVHRMRRQDSGDVGVPGEDRGENVLGHNADLEIGTRLF